VAFGPLGDGGDGCEARVSARRTAEDDGSSVGKVGGGQAHGRRRAAGPGPSGRPQCFEEQWPGVECEAAAGTGGEAAEAGAGRVAREGSPRAAALPCGQDAVDDCVCLRPHEGFGAPERPVWTRKGEGKGGQGGRRRDLDLGAQGQKTVREGAHEQDVEAADERVGGT
jgi:hypothetical protein